ncbi:Manganese transporter [Lachnellula subtilissima]|uniref:Manganese transporter n=1 Tax=Lachnellula subtilissima TaxID=602034 RepID=A0A8H8RAU0_9HELO|nr:Manganese transporter [Lachnellula subtilissima]
MTFIFSQESPVKDEPPRTPSQDLPEKNHNTVFEQKANDVNVSIEAHSLPARSHLASFTSSFKNSFAKHEVLQLATTFVKFAKFMGPGAIISVAYIDPDNYQTAISSGALHYKLLFMILVSNVIAIYLQVCLTTRKISTAGFTNLRKAMSIKLGSVTGLNLAQMNRVYLPRWLNISSWIIAEASIVCTDISSVIGTAIAINILIPKIPLVAGCGLAIADTLFTLLFYRPDGSLRGIRLFEVFITGFVLSTFICFCIELFIIRNATVGEVFKGYLPSRDIFVSDGFFLSCAILGGTLMPHTLYLGSSLVQVRLRDFDIKNSSYSEATTPNFPTTKLYRPSLSAIRSCMNYSIAELCITLFLVAIFINSAILIIAVTSLSAASDDADLYSMYDLFVHTISQAAGTMFALALLFSGVTAGIVATMASQLVAEGAIDWRLRPFYRRLLTRSIAITPGIIIAAACGRSGMAAALNGCNVVLSISLIFLIFPLIWYTSFDKYMMVETEAGESIVTVETLNSTDAERVEQRRQAVNLANSWPTLIVGWILWFLIAAMNVATLTSWVRDWR